MASSGHKQPSPPALSKADIFDLLTRSLWPIFIPIFECFQAHARIFLDLIQNLPPQHNSA